jgi:hypothetical protein
MFLALGRFPGRAKVLVPLMKIIFPRYSYTMNLTVGLTVRSAKPCLLLVRQIPKRLVGGPAGERLGGGFGCKGAGGG